MLFAVKSVHGPGWEPARPMRAQALWDNHAVFMNDLEATGFVVLGGPLGADAGALLIVDADDEEAVNARLAADPWLATGHLRIAMVEPWTILLGDETRLSR